MSVVVIDGGRDLKGALARALDACAAGLDFSRGIVLKPNIVFPRRERSGEITRLAVVKALVNLLRERVPGVDVMVAEGVAAGCDARENFRVSGYERLSRALGMPLLDLHGAPRTRVPWAYGTIELPRVVLERCYINLPILKVSTACTLSGALKNQKGLVSVAGKKQFHREGLHERVAALNAAIRPALTILDCSRFFGKNVFLAGDNCGEIDSSACALLGIDEPEHVAGAAAAGVFSRPFGTSGDSLDRARFKRLRRPGESKSVGRLRIWSNPRACSRCRGLLSDLRYYPHRSLSFFTALTVLRRIVVGGEVVVGADPSWRHDHRDVICLGECTRSIAAANGYRHVPGCPPTAEDLLRRL